jgi:predicted Zn-dependent peptidase
VDLTEPKQTAERRDNVEDPLARLSRLDIVYKVPPRLTPDDDALQVLGTVLSGGRSSRFFQSIVREQQLSTGVNAGRDGAVGPGLFRVVGTVTPGKSVQALEAAVYAQIERVKNEPIGDWEIEKARNNAKRAVVGGLTSSLQRAMQLAEFAASYGDVSLINQRVDRMMKVTAADVQRVARTYLVPENRTVVVTMPRAARSQEVHDAR